MLTPQATTPVSARLRADVALVPTVTGHVLQVGDTFHAVRLEEDGVRELLDALTGNGSPRDARARAAFAALVDAGLVDPTPPRLTVEGDGVLADAIRGALVRMGSISVTGGRRVVVMAGADPHGVAEDASACWVHGHHVVFNPGRIPTAAVIARHRAATLQRYTGGSNGVRSARAALQGPGLEYAAVQVAAELLGPDRVPHQVVLVDLVQLSVSRHPVLPVPPAPR